MVCQPVQQCRGQLFVPEYLNPFTEAQIGRYLILPSYFDPDTIRSFNRHGAYQGLCSLLANLIWSRVTIILNLAKFSVFASTSDAHWISAAIRIENVV